MGTNYAVYGNTEQSLHFMNDYIQKSKVKYTVLLTEDEFLEDD